MISRFRKIYYRQMFIPTFTGIWINPYYIIRKGLLEGVRWGSQYMKGRLLDFGCGNKPYRELLKVDDYVGLDIETSGHSHEGEDIDVFYDGRTIPFDNDSFDSVFTSEVFEHVFNLPEVLKELHRVLRPGGHMLMTLPFVWEEHEVPYDFARYTSFAIEHLMKEAGFEIVDSRRTTPFVATVLQMWNAYVCQYLLPRSLTLKILLNPVFIAPVTILGLLLSRILPDSGTLYHNNVYVVRKPASKSDESSADITGSSDKDN